MLSKALSAWVERIIENKESVPEVFNWLEATPDDALNLPPEIHQNVVRLNVAAFQELNKHGH